MSARTQENQLWLSDTCGVCQIWTKNINCIHGDFLFMVYLKTPSTAERRIVEWTMNNVTDMMRKAEVVG
jgi:hypothetical protein